VIIAMPAQGMTRIEQLKKFISEDSTDPFPCYGLALEYLRDQPARAKEVFDQLLSTFPDYLPTYYPAAQLLMELREDHKGEEVYQKGIELARRKGDTKTEHELKQAYDEWLQERENK
jgi:hypothetical protein